MSSNIGFIETVPIKDVWKKEDANFTPWLEENIDELNKVLGIGLANPQREVAVGAFSVDLVAETDVGDVVIENQFGKSDHRHLGQLVTYLSVRDVQRAIWILEEARPEHVTAVQTLNARGLGQIWMVTMRAIKIGESARAPLFTVVAKPDIEAVVPPRNGEIPPGQERKRDFLAALFAQSREEGIGSPFEERKPAVTGIIHRHARGPGLLYRVAVNRKRSRVVVTNAPGMWQGALDAFRKHQAEIDKAIKENEKLSGKLEWYDEVSDTGRWVIRYTVDVNYQDDPPDPAKLRELNEASAAMKRVFDPLIKDLDEKLQDGDDSESAGG